MPRLCLQAWLSGDALAANFSTGGGPAAGKHAYGWVEAVFRMAVAQVKFLRRFFAPNNLKLLVDYKEWPNK